MKLDLERAWETFKLTFCIIGVGGYAGYLSSMTIAFRIVSVITVCVVLSGIYRMTTKENDSKEIPTRQNESEYVHF